MNVKNLIGSVFEKSFYFILVFGVSASKQGILNSAKTICLEKI
jgi:hypothetical protein